MKLSAFPLDKEIKKLPKISLSPQQAAGYSTQILK